MKSNMLEEWERLSKKLAREHKISELESKYLISLCMNGECHSIKEAYIKAKKEIEWRAMKGE